MPWIRCVTYNAAMSLSGSGCQPRGTWLFVNAGKQKLINESCRMGVEDND